MTILIKNGTVVTAAGAFPADVVIEGEKIKALEDSSTVPADHIIDAAGRLILPGAIDVHTHLDMPFGGTVTADDFASGTRAAAAGGTTTIVDYAIQSRGGTLREALEAWHRRAAGKSAVDYGFHLAVTDLREEVLEEIPGLIRDGYPSYKVFMAYKGALQVDDATLFRVLRLAGRHGGLVLVHAENGDVIDVLTRDFLAEGKTAPLYHALSRPPEVEEEATARFIALARMAGAPAYVVHLSAAGALDQVARARAAGQPIFAETCPQYLFLSLDRYKEPDFGGAKYVMSPPLRAAGNEEALWRGLAAGTLQTVASDHCSFNLQGQKELGRDDYTKIPNGAPGVETRVQLLYAGGVNTGRISLPRFVDLVSTAPARLFGLYPRKGTIAVGSDADLVIFNPEAPFTITAAAQQQNVDYNPYEGFQGKGVPEKVLCRGRVVAEAGRFTGEAGYGRFLPRSPFTAP